jgi:hypothetical protein
VASEERRFPICQLGITIPWSLAERAYEGYVKRCGGSASQSLQRLAERGGFYASEMDEFAPGWRAFDQEMARLIVAEKDLRTALSEAIELAEEMSPENEWAGGRRPPAFEARLAKLKAIRDGKEA